MSTSYYEMDKSGLATTPIRGLPPLQNLDSALRLAYDLFRGVRSAIVQDGQVINVGTRIASRKKVYEKIATRYPDLKIPMGTFLNDPANCEYYLELYEVLDLTVHPLYSSHFLNIHNEAFGGPHKCIIPLAPIPVDTI